jgi:hypothetical protein
MSSNIENLINWGELSRILAGTRSVVTKSRIPKKHQEKVNELITALQNWYDTVPEPKNEA